VTPLLAPNPLQRAFDHVIMNYVQTFEVKSTLVLHL